MKLYTLSIFLVLCACTEKSILNYSSIRFIEKFPKTLEISGEKVPLDLVSPSTFFIIDTLLIVQNYNQENYLSVYNLQKMTKINDFIPQGRGVNEFLGFTYCDYYEIDSNQIYIYFTDINQRSMFAFNLTRSISENKTITTPITTFNEIPFKTKYKKNMPLLTRTYDHVKKQIMYTRHNLQNEVSREYILYDRITDIERNQVGSADKIKPDFKKLAQAMLQFDQINILDLEREEHLSLTTSKNFMHLPLDDSKEPNMYYSDLCVTDKQIYALYANQPITRWGLDSKKSEIQVFNWNGDPVCKIIIPEYLLYINIDEKNKHLYGITADEELYRFRIPNI